MHFAGPHQESAPGVFCDLPVPVNIRLGSQDVSSTTPQQDSPQTAHDGLFLRQTNRRIGGLEPLCRSNTDITLFPTRRYLSRPRARTRLRITIDWTSEPDGHSHSALAQCRQPSPDTNRARRGPPPSPLVLASCRPFRPQLARRHTVASGHRFLAPSPRLVSLSLSKMH